MFLQFPFDIFTNFAYFLVKKKKRQAPFDIGCLFLYEYHFLFLLFFDVFFILRAERYPPRAEVRIAATKRSTFTVPPSAIALPTRVSATQSTSEEMVARSERVSGEKSLLSARPTQKPQRSSHDMRQNTEKREMRESGSLPE